ncbi:hypothetical protein [Isoalcanivorax indicus]|uniref:hypothetical protein n=1 Tax=Isoalcanivorax indicus TaxID=2202653 RepID=UPI0013C4C600|nr:hypothetical protein [Isoalcanivorax indicus]
MDSYIYIDQNTLSDLRERKLKESEDGGLRKIREFCCKDGIRLVYSETHLQEIAQIPKEEYRQEHIELLSELRGVYITPITTELNGKDPNLVWLDFLNNENENEASGINKVVTTFDRFSRKFSGLPIEESFEELNSQLKAALKEMLENAERELNNLDPSELLDGGAEAIKEAQSQIAGQLEAVSKISAIDLGGEQELGPKPLRDLEKLKALQLESLPEGLVISTIDELFTSENSDFNWSDYFDETVHNQIARCYSLMNWAGYYADDFTSTKKRKDRFRASNNDLMHVRNAAGAALLISKDIAFIKKAKACYSHLGVNTVVVNANEVANYL